MNQKILNDCPKILRDFLFYMETVRGRSSKTVEAYYTDLRLYLRYLKMKKMGIGTPEELNTITIEDIPLEIITTITLSDIYEYLNFVMETRGNEAKSRARKVSSLRSFYRYLTTKTSCLKENPLQDLEVPSVRKSLPKYLNLEQSLELLAHVNTKFPERDYCILTLFLNCGMRVSELCGINLSDIDLTEKQLRLLGKGNKERIVYLNEACINAIQLYRPKRCQPKSTDGRKAFFLSQFGNRLTARRVEQIVAQCLTASGLENKGITPHKLRHTAATLMYQHGGVDVRVLQEILGHANLSTTEIYTHVSSKQIEDAADRSPLSRIKITPKSTDNPSKNNSQ